MRAHFCVALLLLACGGQVLAVRRSADEAMTNTNTCLPGPEARRTRNRCCHKKGAGEGKNKGMDETSCEADGGSCDVECFMLDKSEGGGHKMCKPVCDAKELLTQDEAHKIQDEVDEMHRKAENDLADAKKKNEDTTKAEAAVAAAQAKKNKIAVVVETVEKEDDDAEDDETECKTKIPEVREEVAKWAQAFTETCGLKGDDIEEDMRSKTIKESARPLLCSTECKAAVSVLGKFPDNDEFYEECEEKHLDQVLEISGMTDMAETFYDEWSKCETIDDETPPEPDTLPTSSTLPGAMGSKMIREDASKDEDDLGAEAVQECEVLRAHSTVFGQKLGWRQESTCDSQTKMRCYVQDGKFGEMPKLGDKGICGIPRTKTCDVFGTIAKGGCRPGTECAPNAVVGSGLCLETK